MAGTSGSRREPSLTARSRRGPQEPRYTISIVAERFGLHPQTLRLYEREGLLAPSRSQGNTRLYSDRDLERLELILSLTRELGVNLAGVEVILHMRDRMEQMQDEIQHLLEFFGEEVARRIATTEGRGDALIPVPRPRWPVRVRDKGGGSEGGTG